jgi:3-deoxy-D-arabino-heptulosonate 7-phosphate (DAHP) synthase class II
MVWVGERTRQLDAAHLEFVRGIGNPLGVKISDKCSPDELLTVSAIICYTTATTMWLSVVLLLLASVLMQLLLL